MKDKEILTVKQLADYLSLHPLTVQRLARENKLPAFKIGTDWRFHKKYIDKWIRRKISVPSTKERQNTFLND
ncbi:MAG: helix-turn-helix domain-containing protein [Candidatus Omnitrophota bacterium]